MKKLLLKIFGLEKEFEELQKASDILAKITAKESETDFPRKFVYEDKFGNRYYEFTESIPKSRIIIVQSQFSLMALGISKDIIYEHLQKVRSIGHKIGAGQDVQENLNLLFNQFSLLQERIELVIQGTPEINTALALYTLEDEPVQLSPVHISKKKDIWSQDFEAFSFFLCEVLKTEKELQNLSVDSVIEYLNEKHLDPQTILKNATIGETYLT